jgi:hypothetical protein
MTEPARDLLEKNVTLTNGLKIHYYEWPGPPAAHGSPAPHSGA